MIVSILPPSDSLPLQQYKFSKAVNMIPSFEYIFHLHSTCSCRCRPLHAVQWWKNQPWKCCLSIRPWGRAAYRICSSNRSGCVDSMRPICPMSYPLLTFSRTSSMLPRCEHVSRTTYLAHLSSYHSTARNTTCSKHIVPICVLTRPKNKVVSCPFPTSTVAPIGETNKHVPRIGLNGS